MYMSLYTLYVYKCISNLVVVYCLWWILHHVLDNIITDTIQETYFRSIPTRNCFVLILTTMGWKVKNWWNNDKKHGAEKGNLLCNGLTERRHQNYRISWVTLILSFLPFGMADTNRIRINGVSGYTRIIFIEC